MTKMTADDYAATAAFMEDMDAEVSAAMMRGDHDGVSAGLFFGTEAFSAVAAGYLPW